MDNTNENEKKSYGIKEAVKEYWYVFAIIFSLFILFFCGLVFIVPEVEFAFPPKVSIANMGVFGDSFNVLTSLFTGLAFAGLLVSIFIQRRELKETKEEFVEMNKLQVRQQFRNDMQRDIEYIKNSINSIMILDSKGLDTTIKIIINADKSMVHAIAQDLEVINQIFEVHFKYYFENYNKSDLVKDAKEELMKVISTKYFSKIIYLLLLVNKECKEDLDSHISKYGQNIERSSALETYQLMIAKTFSLIDNKNITNSFNKFKCDKSDLDLIKEFINKKSNAPEPKKDS